LIYKILKISIINIILFSFLFSQNNFSWVKTQNLYKNTNHEYMGNLKNCAVLGKNKSQKISSSIFYQNYSWTGSSFSKRGLGIKYLHNGLGISANIVG
jgi:hypothetical protein